MWLLQLSPTSAMLQLLPAAAFFGIVVLVVSTALGRLPGFRKPSGLYVAWTFGIVVFCLSFWGAEKFWELLALVLEIAGVSYLAAEVAIGHAMEAYDESRKELVLQLQTHEQLIQDARDGLKNCEELSKDILPQFRDRNEKTKQHFEDNLKGGLIVKADAEVKMEQLEKKLSAIDPLSFRRIKLRAGVGLVLSGLTLHGLIELMSH